MCGHKAGFSLIEIIIVVGMLGVLATITMLNFRGNTIQDQVQAAANITQSNLTLARTYARTGKICCGDKAPGYGILFNTSTSPQSITLYADVDSDSDLSYTSGVDEIIAFSTIDEKVEFVPRIHDLLFATDGSVKMSGEDWRENQITTYVVQAVDSPTIKKTITLYYPSGLIEQQ